MIHILSCFQLLNSRTLITQDREDSDVVDKYLGRIYGMKDPFDLIPFSYCFTHINVTIFS